MVRNAYWLEFQEAIKGGMAKEISEYNLIEVKIPIQINVCWKDKEGQIEYLPGQVLHREWRGASDWEIRKWNNFPEKALRAIGVFRKNGKFFIQMVEKIKDLPAAIRQRGRHIPARKISKSRRQFNLAGDAQLLAGYAVKLSGLLQGFLEARKPDRQLMEKTSLEFAQISLLLEGSRTSLKKKALAEIQLAQQGRFWEIQARTGQILTNLLDQRVEDYKIATKSIELAEKWCDLMADIERRFQNCYNRLGKLGENLQGLRASGQPIQPEKLLPIANEAYGIWIHLTERVPNFNPYYQRLQEPEFQRLSRIVLHAEAGQVKTVFNDIEEAIAKLEAVAIGEKVSRVELEKEKITLF